MQPLILILSSTFVFQVLGHFRQAVHEDEAPNRPPPTGPQPLITWCEEAHALGPVRDTLTATPQFPLDNSPPVL